MRRAALALACLLLPALASAGWFRTDTQEGYRLFQQGRYRAAARHFQDPYRKGVALYRAGEFAAAAAAFAAPQRQAVALDARYNLGNAWFRLGEYRKAIDAYTQVLKARPDHEDAAHNLALARAALGLPPEPQPKEDEAEEQQE